MPDISKYKSINVDLTTHEMLRRLSVMTDRSIVSILRGVTHGLSNKAFHALERANARRLNEAREEGEG